MTDSFGFSAELELEKHPTERVEELKRLVAEENTTDPEEIMLIIMEVFNSMNTNLNWIKQFIIMMLHGEHKVFGRLLI